MLFRLKKLVLGDPLADEMLVHEKISKKKALAILSSDALSSVAYATEEILIPLTALSAAAAAWSIPIAALICLLLLIVTFSYRQTIRSYPNGGGAFVVAEKNLGRRAGLIAAAALLVDYILTVAVSVSAGVENLTSAFTCLQEYRVPIDIVVILSITILNLRGVRESAKWLAAPAYFFLGSIGVLIVTGIVRAVHGMPLPASTGLPTSIASIPLLLGLRAFASGCSALTGIEAISNGVPLFRNPAPQNARSTLLWMAALLCFTFLGITGLAHVFHLTPDPHQTLISHLGTAILGHSLFYYFLQISTGLILVLAANTSYADFPRLAALLAREHFLPKHFAARGDRLVFSNGILWLSLAAIVLLVLFHGRTHLLIPIYAVGVFLSFTLSQLGMVRHHWRERVGFWKRSLALNASGAFATAIVLFVISISKFGQGAWAVLLLIAAEVWIFERVREHYDAIHQEAPSPAPIPQESLRHLVVVPISSMHRGVITALQYANTISDNVQACAVDMNDRALHLLKSEWKLYSQDIPLVVVRSPYRFVVRPLIQYVDKLARHSAADIVTIVVPQLTSRKWIPWLLHRQLAFLIRIALIFRPNRVVATVHHPLDAPQISPLPAQLTEN